MKTMDPERRAIAETARRRGIVLALRYGLPNPKSCDMLKEQRANPYHDPKTGRFTTGGKSGKSARSAAKLGKTEKKRVSSAILTDHPNYKAGEKHVKYFGKNRYDFVVKGPGEYDFKRKTKIKGTKRG